jgi:hypothetical protein
MISMHPVALTAMRFFAHRLASQPQGQHLGAALTGPVALAERLVLRDVLGFDLLEIL